MKVLALVIALLWKHGIQVYAYLDDILLSADSYQVALGAVQLALQYT